MVRASPWGCRESSRGVKRKTRVGVLEQGVLELEGKLVGRELLDLAALRQSHQSREASSRGPEGP